jgi:hypothetical protein
MYCKPEASSLPVMMFPNHPEPAGPAPPSAGMRPPGNGIAGQPDESSNRPRAGPLLQPDGRAAAPAWQRLPPQATNAMIRYH